MNSTTKMERIGRLTGRFFKLAIPVLGIAAGLSARGATPIVDWRMLATGNTFPNAVVNSLPGNYNIGTFNSIGNAYVTTNLVPPLGMFVNGHGGGTTSFNAESLGTGDGALFYPQDAYGNIFSFTNSFSVEMMFQTDGNQSGAGIMTLLRQGEGHDRFDLTLNNGGLGNVLFTFTSGLSTNTVNLSSHNYADGQWHYVLATFDRTGSVMKLTVADASGSDTTGSTSLPVDYQSIAANSPANDGNLFIGRNTYCFGCTPQNFAGFLSEIQISSGVVGTTERMGRIPSADGAAPATSKPVVGVQPVAVGAVLGGTAQLTVAGRGNPNVLTYQWRLGGLPINGATNSSISYFPLVLTNGGNYDVVLSNTAGSVTSSVAAITVLSPYNIGYWRMEKSIAGGSGVGLPNNNGGPTYTGIVDDATNAGQGILATGTLAASIDPLATFNAYPDGQVPLSTNVPPLTMFVNGHGPGISSFSPGTYSNLDGGLFFLQDQYGDELDFTGPFSVEMFFKTSGDQSGAGVMEFCAQGQDVGRPRWELNMNQAAPGALRFTLINRTLGTTNSVDLTGANYADGNWHYVLAVCDSLAGSNGQLRITVANQGGSDVSVTNSLPAGFLPLPVENEGNSFFGSYKYGGSDPDKRPFLGFLDEIQVSAGFVSAAQRVGRIPSIDGASPSNIKPYVSTQPQPVSALLGTPASFSVVVNAQPSASYQWRFNGVAIMGATNSSYSLAAVTSANAGNYDVVVSNVAGTTNSATALLTVLPPYSISYWRMETNITVPDGNGNLTLSGIADSDTGAGQGIFSTGSLAANIDPLATFNGLAGQPVTLSTNVAPANMFINGHNAGTHSYNAEAIVNVDGGLFFLQDAWGDEMDFTGPFTIEMFFKADGDQSGYGPMCLFAQGSDVGRLRYSIKVNEVLNDGSVTFTLINRALGVTNTVNLAATNYADGNWHYLVATCDPSGGANGQIKLQIANQDGSDSTATSNVGAGFLPLPVENEGNAFIGRFRYPVSDPNAQTFIGLIDEVQVSAGVIPAIGRIGRLPSQDVSISSITVSGSTVQINFTGASSDVPASFKLQSSTTANGTYADVSPAATITALGAGSFRATTSVNGSVRYYRIHKP